MRYIHAPMPAIVVEDLRKAYRVAERRTGAFAGLRSFLRPRYRRIDALDGASFTVETGELIGYIGPNGAGKSTTVKLLAGILVPDGGRCEVLGRIPWRERIAHVRRIGVVFGQRTQLWWDLPARDSFDLLRDIYRIAPDAYRRTLDELTATLDLGPLLSVPVRQLSLGQRMRCDLAAALVHAPDILFLDEPTIGLDAVSKLAVRRFIQRVNRERRLTVILTTHDMDDIESLCSRVLVLANGRILSDGPLEALRAKVTHERWLIVDLAEPDAELVDPAAEVIRREGDRVTLRFDPSTVSTADLVGRISARYAVRDLLVQNPPIEEIIAHIYADEAAR
jgi:ABC-2 type transport system ATP-binding protein